MESTNTTGAEAQFGIARVLKPFEGFEKTYDGQTAAIAFPGGRDERAGQPGYSPNLAAAIQVPLGAKIILWIPAISSEQDVPGAPVVYPYRYRIVQRFRNLRDFRNFRGAFHLPVQSTGAPDTTGVTPEPRVVMPAAKSCVIDEFPPSAPFVGPNGNLVASGGVSSAALRQQGILPAGPSGVNVFLPTDGPGPADTAVFQQGILDPAVDVRAWLPIFNSVQLECEGDEIIILVDRTDGLTWEFGGRDKLFSDLYGVGGIPDSGTFPPTHPVYPYVGIYLMTGQNP